MIYVRFYILAIVLNAIPIRGNKNAIYSHGRAANGIKLTDQIRENREELKRIIDFLNGHISEEAKRSGQKSNDLSNGLKNYDAGLDDELMVDDQVNRIRGLLKLLQRSYDKSLRSDLIEEPSESRIHVISNPEVLEDFKRSLRSELQSTSSESDMETSSSVERYYGMQMRDSNDNHGRNLGVLPASVIIIRRNSRLGSPSRIREVSNERTKSNDMYEETKLSWDQMEASHERFNTKKREDGIRNEMYKGAIKKTPKSHKGKKEAPREVVKNLAIHSKRDEERSRSVERWKKVDRGYAQPKRSRQQAYRNKQGSRGSGRTSIPFIGRHGIYEEEE